MIKKLTTLTQISPRILGFLTHLEANNNKIWMDERRDFYQEAKHEILSFGQTLTQELSQINPDMERVDIRKCIFRINRDIRFSRYKIPYKPRFALHIAPGGTKSDYAGLHLHLQPDNQSYMGGGHYSVGGDYRKLMWRHINDHRKEFESIITNKEFIKTFGQVQGKKRPRLPHGYKHENIASLYLQQDSWYVTHRYTDEEVTSMGFMDQVKSDYHILKPFADFCNQIINLNTIITQS